jgi:Rrf2 family protein
MLSNTSKYAIRAVIYLALYASKKKKIGIRQISGELGIPTPFLGKILQILVKKKILASIKGPNGGFWLAKPAIDISLMEIVDEMEGKDIFDQCVIRTSSCSSAAPCSIHHKIAPYRENMRSILTTETIADLVSEFRSGRERIRI